MNKKLVLLLVALVFAAGSNSLSARTWTRASDGATIEGEFVRMKDAGTIYVARTGGKTIELSLKTLSAEDQNFIKEKAANATSEVAEKMEIPKGETEVALSGVHLCCGGCEQGVEDAVVAIEDLEIDISNDIITLKGKSGKVVQSAIDSIAAAGFYGTSSNEAVTFKEDATSDETAASVTVSNVHLCCGKCVRAIDAVVSSVEGAAKHDAEKGSDSFTITGGNIKPAEVLAALHAEGMNGKVK